MKRYSTTINLNVHASNEHMAKKQIEHLTKELNKKYDCNAGVTYMEEKNFGEIKGREINLITNK